MCQTCQLLGNILEIVKRKQNFRGSAATYTEQKKKHNNYISLNFEQTMIQLEIIAFSTSALDIRLPNARNRFSF